MTLFELATGELPDSLERDALSDGIQDPAKCELVCFALHHDPSKRPTADDLAKKVADLAPDFEDDELEAELILQRPSLRKALVKQLGSMSA